MRILAIVFAAIASAFAVYYGQFEEYDFSETNLNRAIACTVSASLICFWTASMRGSLNDGTVIAAGD